MEEKEEKSDKKSVDKKEKKEKKGKKDNLSEKSFTKSKSQMPPKFCVKQKPKEVVQHNQSTIDAFIKNKP